MVGTILNVAAVLVGGTAGYLLGNRLPARMQETIIRGLGLVTLVVGLQMALGTHNILIVMFSTLLGGIVGEACRLDDHLNTLGDRIEAWFKTRQAARGGKASSGPEILRSAQNDGVGGGPEIPRSAQNDGVGGDKHSISQAFVTASLIFCVGPLATLGAIQDGLLSDSSLLTIKSSLDLFCSMALSASLGPGVLLAAGSLLAYQGGLSVAAKLLGTGIFGAVTSDMPAIVEMTAAGGVMILGIGFDLLGMKVIRVANLLPAILLAPLFVIVLTQLGVL